jgi:hypothetical protein
MKKQNLIFYITIGLAALFIINYLFIEGGIFNWVAVIPPIIVIGAVVLLYLFPPKKYKRAKTPKIKPSARTMAKVAREQRPSSGQKRKHYPFQVIEGQKGKDDDTPKYH